MSPSPKDYTWQVTGQTQETQFLDNGNQVTGKLVAFTVQPSGYTGSVFIPDAIYQNREAVQETIQGEVDAVMAIHTLKG